MVPKLQKTKLNGTRRDALYRTESPNFSTTSQVDLDHHITEKQPRVQTENTYKCKNCIQDFSGFYAPQKHRSSQHRIRIRTSNLDRDTFLEDTNEGELKEESNSCNHLFVDSEFDKRGHFVFNFFISSSNNSILNEIIHHALNQWKRAAKVNLAFGVVLNNIEDGTCRFLYAHENKTVKQTSILVCT